jgi:hypothetical protein
VDEVTVLFDRFFDDAAIFPPGNAAMDDAVRAHVALLGSPLGRHVGPFVCSAVRLPALGDALTTAGVERIDLALVTPAGKASVAIAAAHDDARLAAAVDAAVQQDLRFKLTAGLHHAVRHTDPETGFEHHGFLNVILAVHAAEGGSGVDVAAVLAERDTALVADSISRLDEAERGRVRARFLSFGTCSVTDPIDDLRRLGLLPLEPVEKSTR